MRGQTTFALYKNSSLVEKVQQCLRVRPKGIFMIGEGGFKLTSKAEAIEKSIKTGKQTKLHFGSLKRRADAV